MDIRGFCQPFRPASGAGILKIASRVGLTSDTSRRRRASKEEEVQSRDTIGDIQPGIPVKVHGILAARRRTTEEQPIQQTLRVRDIDPSIGITVIGDRILIDTEQGNLIRSLPWKNTEVLVGNHVFDRLTGSPASVNVPDDLGLRNVNSREGCLDIDPGDRLGA